MGIVQHHTAAFFCEEPSRNAEGALRMPAEILDQPPMNHISLLFCSSFFIASAYGQSGANDPSFDPGTGADDGYGSIYDIAMQPDGKAILVGWFSEFNGEGGQNIVRLNSDGSRDASFDVGSGTGSAVSVVTLQSDGKVLVGGHFYGYPGSGGVDDLMRLNSDGSYDSSFDSGDGAYPGVSDIAVQPDGKIVISGGFTTYNGVARAHIARLNEDGSLDPSFDPGTGATGGVSAVALLPDGKIMIVGSFTEYAGVQIKCIARLNSDGSLDSTFDPGAGPVSSVPAYISRIQVQPDGKFVIVGQFNSFDGVGQNYITRLNTDGSLDPSFNIGNGANTIVYSVALQSDGKILVGGHFTTFNGVFRNRLTRLNADGSTDLTFHPGSGTSDPIRTMAIQTDGKILIGGSFNSYDGADRNGIARVLVEPSIGISEVTAVAPLHVMPNPTTEKLHLTGLHVRSQWSIFNLQGILLLAGGTRSDVEQVIDVSSLPAGSYLLHAKDGALDRTVRFTKL